LPDTQERAYESIFVRIVSKIQLNAESEIFDIPLNVKTDAGFAFENRDCTVEIGTFGNFICETGRH
jgi:hypothetical protein